ncbi:PREDICTED: ganglioside GM2 activator-like [Rhagoletis zephyria]|uniref:ganglioside GM2 activator-like n=1 Tax=Rhagoletis zephyria TaxID=28612 RepID=UPI0008117C84|nr:PREDICTED: ganglioside GM2 activator-like [Rhagoletis zephyria]
MTFKKLDIEPLPLVISATGKIFLTSDVALNADLPADAEVTLEMNKTVTFGSKKFQLTIPCVDGIGSCTVKVCDVFKLWYNDILCPLIKGGGHGCSCPIKGGNFLNQRTEVKAPLSKLRNLASAIADGDYSFRISVADPAKSKLFGCLEMQMKIKVEK